MDDNLIKEALKVRDRAYTPYSNFKVGAVLVDSNNVVYEGCNIENSSYGLSCCAERNAIFKAVTAGIHEFKKIVVVGDTKDVITPCGGCLQVMSEFFKPETEVILANLKGIKKTFQFKELFPVSFNLKEDRSV